MKVIEHQKAARVMAANEWIRNSRPPGSRYELLGSLWLEGEIAILAGPNGSGKSVLGMQIAESLARGEAIEPFSDSMPPPRRVLYVDLCGTGTDSAARYKPDADEPEPIKPYRFGKGLKMAELDAAAFDSDEFFKELERCIAEYRAAAVVIDDISLLGRIGAGPRLMSELRRLRAAYRLSILLLADTGVPKRAAAFASDLRRLGLAARFADSIFLIGTSGRDASLRYLKQLKHRNVEQAYDTGYLPAFRLVKIGGNFLGFSFKRFHSEAYLLSSRPDGLDWNEIDRVKALHDSGMSFREIAEAVGTTKTRAHRLLKLWTPPKPAPKPEPPKPVVQASEKPYPGHSADQYLIYLGKEPKFWNRLSESEKRRIKYGESPVEEGPDGGMLKIEGGPGNHPDGSEIRKQENLQNYHPAGEAPAPLLNKEGSFEETGNSLDDHPAGEAPAPVLNKERSFDADAPFSPQRLAGLKTALDGYGEPIYIESEDQRGKRMVWYHRDTRGSIYRSTRATAFSVSIEKVWDPE